MLQIAAQDGGIGAGVASARVRLDQCRAIRRDLLSACDQRLAGDEAELLDGPSQSAQPVLLHLHDADTLDVMAMALDALEMSMKLEIVDVVFAVAGGKADHGLVRSDGPQYGQRNLLLIGRDHLDAAVAGAHD